MSISPITKAQWMKVLKALVYSFAAGFTGTFALLSFDVITAAMHGTTAVVDLTVSLIAACAIGGINAVFVTIKQLLTDV